MRRAALPPVLLGLLLMLGLFTSSAGAAPPAPFTHGPTNLTDAAAVLPIGGLNGFSHILPIDHAMIGYPDPANGGMDEFLVYAMGEGELVMLIREMPDDIPDPDYELYVRHSNTLASQYAHLHSLSAGLQAYVDSVPGAWIDFGDIAFLFLGQLGAPAPLPVAAGEVLGTTKSYGHAWDVGVIDSRQKSGSFANYKRYPDLDLLVLFGVELEHAPFKGNRSINAACFLDYMPLPLRMQWAAKLASTPAVCGQAGQDVKTRLQGAWFNPTIDTAPDEALFELEQAALSIVPWSLAPETHVNIALGHGSDFSTLDPDDSLPSIHEDFVIAFDPASDAVVNPDPANVDHKSGTVCYDLAFNVEGVEGFHALFLRLQTPQLLDIQLDSNAYNAPPCESLMQMPPQLFQASYVR